MTSTAVLRTPPASASCCSDYIPLRRPRGVKDKGLGRDNTPSPTTSVISYRVKSPSDRTFGDSPTQPSPSPLRKRVLFERGSSGQREDDDDDEILPSTIRLHSPFASRCASPFLRAWSGHGTKISPSKPVEDDEGLFLASKVTTTPTCTSSRTLSRKPCRSSHTAAVNAGNSEIPTLILTPSVPKRLPLPVLQSPSLPTRTPQTPAEADWHLGRQTESMVKLSLHDDDGDEVAGRHKTKGRLGFTDKEEELSPSLVPKRRGRKRSLDGNELPRCKGGIFETAADTPLMTSFHIPESPSPLTRHKASATEFFGPAIYPSPALSAKPSQLSVINNVSTTARSRSSSPKSSYGVIAKKYRPRDSGVAGIEDEDETEDGLGPLASTQAVVLEEEASGLVTPGVEPPTRSAWPPAAFGQGRQGNVDDFIFKALVAGGAPPREKKVMPSTPVKRNAFALSRPWMSSSKVMPPPAMPRAGGVPRKSLPLSFPDLSQIQSSPDASEISPSDRPLTHRKMHGEIGKGRPPMLLSRGAGENPNPKTHFLMRRSSSGAFSSSSSENSFLGTPTKSVPPSMPSPSKIHSITQSRGRRAEYRLPSLSIKKPSSSQIAGMTPVRRPAFECHDTQDKYGSSPQPSFSLRSRPLTEYEFAGKFEANFVAIDNLGTGEFGNVLKVRNKRGDEKDVFAIKKSKRFEGIKHRRRLREEVDVLKHLTLATPNHPNILKYVDSWEQDDILYIQTELCELGNFGTFLAEYGMHFEALDEARVWKICAELSSGIKFIHSAGVIHLDLKPDNIFVTGEGRFRIGDFGMASLWPRRASDDGFEREGDREYMAPEVLQGRYGKEADVFSFGMIMLETAANIVVPDMGDEWRRLREDDFSAVDFSGGALAPPRSEELVQLLSHMMRSDPDARLDIEGVYNNMIVQRARDSMARKLHIATQEGMSVFFASPLGGEPDCYLEDVLLLRPDSELAMDLSP